ncbi:response regulator [Leptospira gomenensis]|uniref:histidine kinase n=1 Tax=Leptospira gomenensis TaxID=2484974 RepID=A0A5F1Z1A5_9LEPT|nr:ATP-binding protein [Leptospira gomenensis]TGK29019.1 response regulator [Leptospira gomenensis]TGK44986.1 response regulator [Leptospira gomenensis]TGK51877.1 response regulator [Leptospira gomenensis]TGK67315.1 response regulator [Leptospira gomenensis]
MSVNRHFPDSVSLLLAEDDEEDFLLFREYAEDIPFPKYTITRAKSAEEALSVVSKEPSGFDIFVIDHFLGASNGTDLLNELRSAIGPVSAVLFSGLSREEIADTATSAGFTEYLEKNGLSSASISKALLNAQKKGADFILPEPEKRTNGFDPLDFRMETIGKFSGSIAHDYNNILNIIIANLDLMELQCKDHTDLLNRIRAAQNAVLRAVDLNKKLLNFSRRQSLHPELCDPNVLISEFLKNSREHFPINIHVEFNSYGEGDLCLLDKSEFSNAFTQLMSNAKESLAESGGGILIETSFVVLNSKFGMRIGGLKDGPYFLLRLSDNGIGIEPGDREKVFEPFYSTKPKGKSAGLGLPTIYGFVRRSGGNIFFDSRPKIGTDFFVYLPIHNAKTVLLIPESVSRRAIYFGEKSATADWLSLYFRSVGFSFESVSDFYRLRTLANRYSSEDTVFLSNVWEKGFEEWHEFVSEHVRSNQNREIFYFSHLNDGLTSENSHIIVRPVSKKSLENHFKGV